ncbi:MAG: molecular chaperone DnaJ [Thermoplasmata archaeon HGW-Thermoplasmata-1]|nr:MAG: molecular chaperone DnaJ [Thermoplasmata archaeon HGW-Thermoplasmata-1]
MSTKRDYYEILGVGKESNVDEIKKAYRKLALKYHPDRNKDADAEDKFKEISEAYAVLSDSEKRAQYDRFGHAGIDGQYSTEDIFRSANFGDIFRDLGINFGFGGGGFGDIFNAFFGGGRSSGSSGPERGRDIRHDITITLEDAYKGLETEIHVSRNERCDACGGSGAKPGSKPVTCTTCNGRGQVQHVRQTMFGQMAQIGTCPKCRGEGKIIEQPCEGCRGRGSVTKRRTIEVKIPPGVESGMHLRLAGEGEAGVKGGSSGHLYVIIAVKPHPMFKRDGTGLYTQIDVPFPQMALGAEVEVPTIDGAEKLKIPQGTKTGTVLTLSGKGMPRLNSGFKGDLHVQVNVDVPDKVTKEQRELLKSLADTMNVDVKPKRLFG